MAAEIPDINSNYTAQFHAASPDKQEIIISKNSEPVDSEKGDDASHSSSLEITSKSNEDFQERPDSNLIHSEPNINLSRDELLKLLSVFEGELQARDEVIAILKSECTQNPDKRYGLTSQPLKALQRDAALLEMTSHDHVCEQTKEQLQKIIQHQKQSHKKLKQMHLASEEKYQRLSTEVEEEKRKHQEYVLKSDDFVNLLEQDRERLKQILDQEKSAFDRKEREFLRKIKENKEEIARMKSLSLELVEDRQRQLQNFAEQKQLTAALERKVEELRAKGEESAKEILAEKEHALQLENELEEQTNLHFHETQTLNTELIEEKKKTKELEEKVKSLGRQMQKLKCVDKDLRKTDDQLWRIKEKLEQEEKYDDLLEEVELLRRTVSAMQEAEQIYTQAHEECKDLREALEKELLQTKGLREEVEKLRKNARNRTDVERCVEETLFRFDEIQQLFDAEYKKQNKMKKQIEDFQNQLQKIDETETLLKLNERRIKQLQTTVSELKEEKSGLETKFQIEKDKSAQYKDMIDEERNRVTQVTQKTIEESKKVLKAKEQLATLETKLVGDTKFLNSKLEAAEETISNMITKEKANQMETLINNLRKQVAMLKKRLDQIESDYEKKEIELKLLNEEAESAKKNLNTSTEHLKRLVILGLGDQILASKINETSKKSNSESLNTKFEEDIKTLELHLRQSNNSNNTCLKRVSISHSSTQTCGKDEGGGARNSSVRRLSRTNSTSDTKPPSLRRVSSSTERPKAPFRVGTAAVKRASSSVTSRSSSCTRSDFRSSSTNNGSTSVRLKSTEKPVALTTSDSTSGRINNSATKSTNGKKEINTKISSHLTNSSKSNESSFSSAKTLTENSQSKHSKASLKTSSSSFSSNKIKQSSVERRGSSSPTRIPKFRAGTPTSPPPSQSVRNRISR